MKKYILVFVTVVCLTTGATGQINSANGAYTTTNANLSFYTSAATGTLRMRILTSNGFTGIGNLATPLEMLHVNGNTLTTGNLIFGTTAGAGLLHVNSTSNSFTLQMGSTPRLRVLNTSGFVGIGNNPTPVEMLHVIGGNILTTGNLISTAGILNVNSTNPLSFQLNGSPRLTVLNSGNVGIGNTATVPINKLEVDITSTNTNYASATAADLGLYLKNTSATANNMNIISFGNASNNGVAHIGVVNKDQSGHSGALFFATKPSGSGIVQRMMISETGNVGIGTVSPGAKLHIYSPGGVNAGLLTESTSATSYAGSDWKNSSGDLAQMSLTGSAFANGMVLTRQASFTSGAPNGFSLVSYSATGFITFGTGGLLAANERMRINADGTVGIGTPVSSNINGYKLAVKGKIGAYDLQIERTSGAWSDYVFEKDYALPSLTEVEQFIKENKHLKDVPSAREVETNGYLVSTMDATLLKKVEELTLYIIEQQKQIDELKKEIGKNKK